uniref:Osteoclast-stimulating factor 1 n=1 Tax=Nothobranchius furzeri TaxID=105023 RepID=A0A8C6PR34_NOTFU
MNSAEQTVTWLITLGVLESPKKSISDPEAFLQASLQDGVVLCRLLERIRPGTVDKVFQEPRSDGEIQRNINEFIRGCAAFGVEPFEVSDLLQGQNFSKVLNSLVALNKNTEDISGDGTCAPHSPSPRIKSFDSLNTQACPSKVLQHQYRSLDMSDGNGCGLPLVKARFAFHQNNEDELSFSKGDIISVTRQEDGGWWEGSLNDKTGWFPSNYVRELKRNEKQKSGTLKSPPKGLDVAIISKTYYNVVLQNILEAESEYSRELQTLLGSYLRSLHPTDRLSGVDISHIQGNLEEISTFQQMLVQSLDEQTKLPENQQRIGGFFVSLMPQMKTAYVAYCSNHPSAVHVLTQHREELEAYMESKGASSPGCLTLTVSLSKPFTRLERYPALLRELERHMDEQHPDRADLNAAMAAFKNLEAECREVRKKKETELQILTEPIRNWEGDDIKTLGPILHMTLVKVHTQTSQRGHVCPQGRIPLSGMLISRIEDGEKMKNAFEISGAPCERVQVACSSQRDLQDWLDLLTKHTHTTPPHSRKPQAPCHTLPSHSITPFRLSETRGVNSGNVYHTLPHLPSYTTSQNNSPVWGPLEPPSTPKPWTLSCLRPAPPLRPSAALCIKEDKNKKKFPPIRKPERKPSEEDFSARKSTAAPEEDAQILKVIEAYCTSAKTRQTLNSTWQGTDLMHNHVLDENSLAVAGCSGNVQCSDLSEDSDYDSIWTSQSHRTASFSRKSCKAVTGEDQLFLPCRSLVDTVYSLRDEVQKLKQDNKGLKRTLEEEQQARKELERIVRRVLKNMNDPTWDETNL